MRYPPQRGPVYQFAGLLLIALLVAQLTGCGDPPARLEPLAPEAPIVAFGDSLTRGTGAAADRSYPARLGELLGREVINAGVPGELSAQGLARLSAVLDEYQPALVILCHGGNDLLRRQSEDTLAANLRAMIELIRARGSAVVLIGVPRPGLTLPVPALYRDLAREYELPYSGAILSDILGDRNLKSDTVHPNAAGYERLAIALAELIEAAQRR